jgi:hypothetical protein
MQVILSREYSIPEGSMLLINNLDGENKTPLIAGGMFYKDVLSWKDNNLEIHYVILWSCYETAGGCCIQSDDLENACNYLLNSDVELEEGEIELVKEIQKIASQEDNLSTGFFMYNYSS